MTADGHQHLTSNQLYLQDKYSGGEDERRKSCVLFRVGIDSGPGRLH